MEGRRAAEVKSVAWVLRSERGEKLMFQVTIQCSTSDFKRLEKALA